MPPTNRNRHLLLCNGAESVKKRSSDPIETLHLRTFGAGANVRLKVSAITHALSSNLPNEALDLLELSSMVYAADQCCGRTTNRQIEYGVKWRRDFRFRVAVRCPDFWSRPDVHEALWDALCFLSEDDYTLDFMPIKDAPHVQEYLEFAQRESALAKVEQVMLMSGGLDSLAGAVEQVVHLRKRVAMVSHKPVEHLGNKQANLTAAVGTRADDGELIPIHLPVIANKIALQEQDNTQRSRSFLYASLGICAAHLFGLDTVWFYENGVTSVNLPLCAQEVGGRATRTTHPQALHKFGKLFSLVFGQTMKVENGFFWKTKQDVMEVLQQRKQSDLSRNSVSCAHTRQITNPAPHCGMCSQCLARRVAAIGASFGIDDPANGYRHDPFLDDRTKDEERILAERFVGHSRLVSKMDGASTFHTRYAGELARVIPYLNLQSQLAVEKLYELHLRHAQQVNAAFGKMAQENMKAHWDQRLSHTCALTYAFSAASQVKISEAAEAAATSGDTGVYPPNRIIWGGREYRCELSKQEIKVMRVMLQQAEVEVTSLMYKRKDAAWNCRFTKHAQIRNRISQTLHRLSEKLLKAGPPLPLQISLRRGANVIERLDLNTPPALRNEAPEPDLNHDSAVA